MQEGEQQRECGVSQKTVQLSTVELADAVDNDGEGQSRNGTTKIRTGEGGKYKHFPSFFKRLVDSLLPDVSEHWKIEREAVGISYDVHEERRLKRKLDIRIVPLLLITYIFNQFDRTNWANAKIDPTFSKRFDLDDNRKWLTLLCIFYVGYSTLEIPSNIMQRIVGAPRWFFFILTWWGICSTCVIFAQNWSQAVVLRLLLGMGEAGFYSGIVYYLSFWYPPRELALRIAYCATGTIPGILGGFLAFGALRADNPLLHGWQVLFLVEGVPTLIMAVCILCFLPAFPSTASYLTRREKLIAVARIQRDVKPTPEGGMGPWESFKSLLNEPNMILFSLIYGSVFIGVSTISNFTPTIIKDMGYSSITSQAMQVPPYTVAWLFTYFQAWSSDRTRQRAYHIMVSTGISFVGYVLLSARLSPAVSYFALFLVLSGNFSSIPLISGWTANSFAPTFRRGIAIGAMVSFSNIVSIASSWIYFDPEESYRKAHGIVGGCMAACFLTTLTLRLRFRALNKSREQGFVELLPEERRRLAEEGEQIEIPDWDQRFRFML